MPLPTRRCGSTDPIQTAKGQKQENEELGGYHREEGYSHPEALYQGSHSMNRLTSSLHSYSHFLSQCLKSRSNRDLFGNFITVN